MIFKVFPGVALVLLCAAAAQAAEPVPLAQLGGEYQQAVLPLVKKYCLDCHDRANKEGELDLEQFARFEAVRGNPAVWVKVEEMLVGGEMPPEDSDQPAAEERKLLHGWVKNYLHAEALAGAGDPGPVVLRRLSNAQYTYTIADLTGVSLNPAEEFPVDGAAGEGFTNTGSALVMSPALFTKYLDAAKGVADHAVLLPDGMRFSADSSRRDWTNEILAEIQAIYLRNTSGYDDASRLNRWNVSDPLKISDADGRVDLIRYFSVLLAHRDKLQQDPASSAAIARKEQLNAKYLQLLAEMLTANESQSVLLENLRNRWREAKPEAAADLAADVRAWQERLWKFNSVGHYGSVRPWQQPENPLPESVVLRHPIDANIQGTSTSVWLTVTATGDAKAIWRKPRLEFKDRPAILLRDLRMLAAQVESRVARELARTEKYLAAAAELRDSRKSLEEIAAANSLNVPLLRSWTNYLALGRRVDMNITDLATGKLTKVEDYEAINGWGVPQTPCFFANSSDKPISFLTLTVPAGGITVHPSPELEACVGWRSPIAGKFRLTGKITDRDGVCGNGAVWKAELRGPLGIRELGQGVIENGKSAPLPAAELEIQQGDLVIVRIGPRDRNHGCDTTQIELTLTEQGEKARRWDLAADTAADILAGNPHKDSYGNEDVWHFFTSKGDAQQTTPSAIPLVAGSALAKWREAARNSAGEEELQRLAAQVQAAITAEDNDRSQADKQMVQALSAWDGPLGWLADAKLTEENVSADSTFGLAADQFGTQIDGQLVENDSLFLAGSQALEIRLPAALVRGGEFVAEGAIDPRSSGEASLQLQLSGSNPAQQNSARLPILTRPASPAQEKLTAAYDDFRNLFPSAMCYARIVPVDEVVTLILFHREDEHLSRLMLNEADAARLDHLWNELRYVSQDALISVTAHEQLMAFATQDRPDLLKPFEELGVPIKEKAEAFRRRLVETQPAQVEAVLEFAGRAYRRPLSENESQALRSLYGSLREEKLSHEEAIRLLLARILTAPAFLYRLEQPGDGAEAMEISGRELASRLSYFLWSSLPDDQLIEAADGGDLHDPEILKRETRRMLKHDRARRLAIEFACQWLHIRDFDQLDEKSERHFPEFASLRGDMYEESIRFFTDLAQNDGSVLDLLAADHTFLNETLARHYGIAHVQGDQWRKVNNVQKFGRGGVLTQATVLAKQSGASRTSPILRGNWVSETLLGDRLPRPPQGVPPLPEDLPAGLTERQLIERHSSDQACAKCHARIDPYGFALEQYDAIGRLREKDTENQPVNAQSVLPDSTRLEGATGLRDYLLNQRRDDFLRQFCRKLLGYALGRSVQLSDQPLLDKMLANLSAHDYRFSAAVETIVVSDQFRKIRGREFAGPTNND